MGYMQHHVICITSFNLNTINETHKKCREICKKYDLNILTKEIYLSSVNEYYSFFIYPDGSKEGWEESNRGDKIREEIVDYIEKQKYDDGSNSIKYAYLYYGDDMGKSEIVKHN